MLEEHLKHPGATTLYVGMTRETCKRIMWKDVLERLSTEHDLGLHFNQTELYVRSPNGAVTYFIGIDSSEKEKKKALGQKYRKIWIDEAQDLRTDLRSMVYEILKPAVADFRGPIIMTGTPGDFVGPRFAPDGVSPGRHLFFAITKQLDLLPEEPPEGGWKVHRWSALDNPHMKENIQAEIEDIDRDRPWFRDTPQFKRHYLGQWAIDDRRIIYHYTRGRNAGVPPVQLDQFVIGCDLGWSDASAFVVVGWRKHDGRLYVLRSYKESKLTLSDVSNHLRALQLTYPHSTIVIDGANRQGVEELARRYMIPLVATEKSAKVDFIRMMDTDLRVGNIVVDEDQCNPLIEEWAALVWDDDTIVPRERPDCENHCCDAALYAWRYARNYYARPAAPPPPKPGSYEALQELERKEAERVEREQNGEFED